MDSINLVIAQNIKRIREERKLSLDALSKLSCVSKSMLGQIERGSVNPTISTLWKIANGLKIPFTEFMSRPESDCEVVDFTHMQPLVEDSGRCRNYPVFPFDVERRFETLVIELDPCGHLTAEAHPIGTQEFITVFSGRLRVLIDGKGIEIGPGEALRFKADRAHGYENPGEDICRMSMIIHYPQ